MEELEKMEQEAQEAILPEGYGEGDNYFEEESWGKGAQVPEPAEQAQEEEEGNAKQTRDFRSEAEEFYTRHPGYQGGQMPKAVLDAWLSGTGLGEAFAAYERGQSRAEARRLQRENQVLRQNAAAAMRAPVRGVGGGGDTKQEPEDPFLMGFNDEKW